jgi:Ca2+-dependent lipid-binding protein
MRALEVTVGSVNHLPKTDTLGACDPYLSVEFGGKTEQTSIKKRVYAAEYNESFTFMLTGKPEVLALTLFDWNRTSSNSKIGTSMIQWETISHFLAQPLGSEQNLNLNIYEGGKQVIGNDKLPTELNIRIRSLSSLSTTQLPHVVRRRVA